MLRGRSAGSPRDEARRAPRATGRERVSNDGSKPQPPTRRGVGAEEPRPTAWGGARRELATQTTAPSTQRAESRGSVGGRLVLHVTKRARAARHGTRTSQQRRFEAAAADTARCRWRGASANGVGWSAPRVGHADNRAKHAARRDKWLRGRSAGSPRDEALPRRGPRDENETATTVRSRSRQHCAVSVQRSLGQRRGVERAASWPRRQPRQARSAQRAACSVGGRLVLHATKRVARRAPRDENESATTVRSRSRRPSAVSVQRSLGQLRGVEHAASWPRRQPRQARGAQRQVLRGRSAGSPRGEARAWPAPRDENETATTVRSRGRRPSAVSLERSLGQLREVERAASGPRRQPRQARSAQRQVRCGRSAGSPRGGARARRAPRDENETATTVRSRSRRPSAVSVERSLGQRRGLVRVASGPRRQPREARSAQCMLCGWSAGSPRDEARGGRAPRD